MDRKYEPDQLLDLHKFTEKCNCTDIRDWCEKELGEKNKKEALEVAVQLGLDDIKVFSLFLILVNFSE